MIFFSPIKTDMRNLIQYVCVLMWASSTDLYRRWLLQTMHVRSKKNKKNCNKRYTWHRAQIRGSELRFGAQGSEIFIPESYMPCRIQETIGLTILSSKPHLWAPSAITFFFIIQKTLTPGRFELSTFFLCGWYAVHFTTHPTSKFCRNLTQVSSWGLCWWRCSFVLYRSLR